jgi:hypothetical protein
MDLDSAEFSSLLASLLLEHDAVDMAALARFDAVFANPAALEAVGWEAATPLIPSMFHQSPDVRSYHASCFVCSVRATRFN